MPGQQIYNKGSLDLEGELATGTRLLPKHRLISCPVYLFTL